MQEAFRANFAHRNELGAACAVFHRGEKVVDLWGGIRNAETGQPWEADTMVLVYSATKGLAAMTMAVAHSRGWLDYDERVAAYWPEFAQHGKEGITVRQLLAHQAGLFALDEPVTRELLSDPGRLADVLARQRPAWMPGSRQAYHAITLGLFEGEILRRVDPAHRTLGQIFAEEIAERLDADAYISLPEDIPNTRLAVLERASPWQMLYGMPFALTLAGLNPRSVLRRSLFGSDLAHDEQRIYARNLESPSGGGVATARAMAAAYGEFATGGRLLRLRSETLQALAASARPSAQGFHDDCMKGEARFSLGFMKPNGAWPFGSSSAYGAPGAGGSFAFADPETGIGYAYVTNRMGAKITGDPRDIALRSALRSAIGELPGSPACRRNIAGMPRTRQESSRKE